MFDRDNRRNQLSKHVEKSQNKELFWNPVKYLQGVNGKKDEISVDCLDFNKKILHTAWHPLENIVAIAATNNLYVFSSKD